MSAPISVRFAPREHGPGPHVLVGVWAGDGDTGRGNCGTLTMRREEWAVLRDAMERAQELVAASPTVERMTDYDASELVCAHCEIVVAADDTCEHTVDCVWRRAAEALTGRIVLEDLA